MLAPDAHPLLPADLIACHECDLLQREPALAPGETARCARCGALLARNPPDSIDRSLALACTAAVLYLIAMGVFSSIVEGRRKATDRVVRGLVTSAFVLAVAPLISTLWTVVSKGMGVLSWSFVTQVGGTAFDADTLEVVATPGALQAIADAGSFSAAGRRIGRAQSAISRRRLSSNVPR